MKQALERIIELVGTIDLRSSSLEVQSTLRTIGQTARAALTRPTPLTPEQPAVEPRMLGKDVT